eukprot:Awhi_evm1s9878
MSANMKTGLIKEFQTINRGYNSVFQPNKLTIGLTLPIENKFNGPVPIMNRQVERVALAEELGFSAIWLRDVPFNVPSFGDAGQIYDPFIYLGYLAAKTKNIALGLASVVLPLRHPAHVAKAMASADVLSDGRLIVGVASGDRGEEYPSMNLPYQERSQTFRDSFDYIRQMAKMNPSFENNFGTVQGNMDMLPKPCAGKLPLFITGSSRQTTEWSATNGDGWITYPRDIDSQAAVIADYRKSVTAANNVFDKPVMQPLYIDFVDEDIPTTRIHLGYRCGPKFLKSYLEAIEQIGVNHVILNMRYNQADVEETLKKLSSGVLAKYLN